MLARLPIHDMSSNSIIVLSARIQYIAALRGSISLAINVLHKNKLQLIEKLLLLQSAVDCSQVSLRDKLFSCPFLVRRAIVLKAIGVLITQPVIWGRRLRLVLSWKYLNVQLRVQCCHFIDEVPALCKDFLK
jgi:hypothetical protein